MKSRSEQKFFLNPIQKQAMRAVWSQGNATVTELMQGYDFGCHTNNLRTNLEKLCEKQFLVRTNEKGVFRYSPACAQSQFLRNGLVEMVRAVLESQRDPASCMEHLVEAMIERDPEAGSKLTDAISRRRSGKKVGQ